MSLKNHYGYAHPAYKGRYIKICPSTGAIVKEYFGTTHLRTDGYTPGGPSAVVLGKCNTYKGFKWVQVPREVTDVAAYLNTFAQLS